MKAINSKGQSLKWRKRSQRLALAAAATLPFCVGKAHAATSVDLYWDTNGATAGANTNGTNGGTGTTAPNTWSAATTFWSTASAGNVATGTWGSQSVAGGSIAHFSAGTGATGAFTVALADAESLSAITFEEGSVTIGTTGAAGWALNFGANPVTININNTTANPKDQIWAPITANSGVDMVINFNQTGTFAGTMVLNGDTLNGNNYLSGFSGNIYANNNDVTKDSAHMPALAMTAPPNTSSQIINVDQFMQLTGDNQQTNQNGHSTQFNYAIPNPIVLNYKGIAPASGHSVDAIGAGNGTSGTSVYGNATFVAGTQRFVTYSGVISSNAGTSGAVTDLYIQGSRGATVLTNSGNLWNGDTIVNTSGGGGAGTNSGNGIFIMGADDVLPATTNLYFGAAGSTGTVGPMDLNGHSIHIAGLGTQTTNNADNGGGASNGNIYNTALTPGGAAPATITITGATNTTYKGDIGDSNLAVNPYNDQTPYVTGTFATETQPVNTTSNISLVINGPGTLTLAPVSFQSQGNEYTGSTTVNGGGLALGRQNTYVPGNAPGTQYTLTGGGAVTIMPGATLATVPTTFGATPTYAGGANGMITISGGASAGQGANLSPGGTGATGLLSTNSMTIGANANLNFDFGSSSVNFDSVYLQGGLTLDSAGTSAVHLGLVPGVSFVTPGTYTLLNAAGGITAGAGLTLDSALMPATETFTPQMTSNTYQVVVSADVVQWDPNGDGAARLNGTPSQTPTENGGTWTSATDGTGSTFVDYSATPFTEYHWNNADARDVIIGNDITQSGADITLGSNIVAGKITFGPITGDPALGAQNYRIVSSGSFTLTTKGGINVNNNAATSTTPSAEIDCPIVLGANQNWSVSSGQFLDIKGSVTGNFALSATGPGVIFLESAGGSIGSLNVNAGTVLFGASDAIGTMAPITLNGGALQSTTTMTLSNALATGSLGGSIGATTGLLTVAQPVTGGNNLTVIGTGDTSFSSGLTVNNLSVTSAGNTTFAGNVTAAAAVSVTSTAGSVTFAGNISAQSFSKTGASNALLSGNNTFSGTAANTINVGGGTLTVNSAGALGASTTPITLATNGNLFMNNLTSLPNPVTLSNVGPNNATITGNVSGSGGLIISGAFTGSANLFLVGPEFTFTNTNSSTDTASAHLATAGMIVHTDNASALGSSSLAVNADSTLDIQSLLKLQSVRGEGAAHTLTKTGAGTFELRASGTTNSTVGSGIVVNQGIVQMDDINSLGTTATNPLNITLNSGGELDLNYANTAATTSRNGGTMTVTDGTIRRLNSAPGNEDWAAKTAADIWTFNGNSLIDDPDTDITNTGKTFGITNPVVVTTGSTLSVDVLYNGGHYTTNHSVNFRGPSGTATAFDTFIIQAGGTVKQLDGGELRFGRVNSAGIPIIGEGTPGNESLIQLTGDCFMCDNTTNVGHITTRWIVNGTDPSDTAGLRIEAAMNATYPDPGTLLPDQQFGTTGLFGANPWTAAGQSGAAYGSAFTVLSPNRAAALSGSYYDGTNTFTQQGTLTLAATDAADATGVVNVGPASACAVTLALDNTAASANSNLTYQIDGVANGATFKNFAGLVVQKTNAGAGSVKAQLVSTTKIPAITLNNNTQLDVQQKALIVDYTGSSPLSAISAMVASGKNGGTWNGPGIMTSNADALGGNTSLATVIAAEASDALHLSGAETLLYRGQTIDATSVLAAYVYRGDANLDGRIDADDYFIIDSNYNKNAASPGFIHGDFNQDGVINGDDYFLIDMNYQNGHGAQLSAPLQIAGAGSIGGVSAVPEPASLGTFLIAAGMLAGRRKRRAR